MGHLLATVNPEAAAAIGKEAIPDPVTGWGSDPVEPAPEPVAQTVAPDARLPGIGETVVYQRRAGDFRAGRRAFPALVLDVHPETAALDLVVVYEAEDSVTLRKVKPQSGIDAGWLPTSAGLVSRDAETVLRKCSELIVALQEQVNALREENGNLSLRIDTLEGRDLAPKPKPAKK